MIPTILLTFLRTKTGRAIVGGLIALAVIGGIFAYLTHEWDKADKEKQAAQIEANRQRDRADGLDILRNSNTQVAEIQREKEKANAQAINSNIAINNLNNSIIRDSNSFTGNFSNAKRRFCQNFPEDSACR